MRPRRSFGLLQSSEQFVHRQQPVGVGRLGLVYSFDASLGVWRILRHRGDRAFTRIRFFLSLQIFDVEIRKTRSDICHLLNVD